MELKTLIEKIRNGTPLLQEEREHLLALLDVELRSMRQNNPKAYLDILNLLMDAVKRASRTLSQVAS